MQGLTAAQRADYVLSSLLLSSLELSDTHKSMSLKYVPASEPLHIMS